MSHPYRDPRQQLPFSSYTTPDPFRTSSYFPSGGSNSDDSPISEVPPHLQNLQMLPPGGYFQQGLPPQGFLPLPQGAWSSHQETTRAGPAKTTRSQFSACGACRHRRVKCDLKAKQEEAERTDSKGKARTKPPSCTNCLERGVLCVYVWRQTEKTETDFLATSSHRSKLPSS